MPYLSKPTAKLVYNTSIAHIFDYCGVVWDTCSDTSATKVQKLQNRAVRQIIGVNNGTPSDAALSQLGWIPLSRRRKNHKAILMYKYLHHEIEGINMDFMKHTDRHSYNTRNKEAFVLPKLRTNQLKGSFKYSAILTCYLLPLDIRKSTSLNTLKRFLKNVNF